MKKFLTVILSLCLCLAAITGAAALAEDTESGAIICEIKDGSYEIRIPAADDDQGWYAEETLAGQSPVTLESAQKQDGCFVARYAPAFDGTATVSVRHYYNACACDQAHTWDLLVKDGKIQENVGGSFTAAPDDADLDPYICGEWLEKDTQFTRLTIAKNEEKGWDVEAVSPLTHGAYAFKATVYYDCYEDAFTYDKGKFFDLPLEGDDLGEPKAVGVTGSFRFDVDEEMNLSLIWTADEILEAPVIFEKAAEDEVTFDALSKLEWTFSSGAGAWSTDLSIQPDGAFTGEYHDSEMGDADESYPNGTVYICSFSGHMTLEKQADSWQIIIDALTLNEAPEQETIEDGIRYITAEPYGISEGDTMRLYLPGTPVDSFTDDMRMWAHLYELEATDTLPDWFLYSEKNESGFVGYSLAGGFNMPNPWVDLTADELMQVSGVCFGVPEGAENVIYRYLASEGLAEMQFTLDGDEFCARIQPADLRDGELMNIAGMYFVWDHEEDITVGHCYGTVALAKTGSEDWVELCQWYDLAPGLMYSLSAYTTDPDGLDLTAVAEQVYIPMQGDN